MARGLPGCQKFLNHRFVCNERMETLRKGKLSTDVVNRCIGTTEGTGIEIRCFGGGSEGQGVGGTCSRAGLIFPDAQKVGVTNALQRKMPVLVAWRVVTKRVKKERV